MSTTQRTIHAFFGCLSRSRSSLWPSLFGVFLAVFCLSLLPPSPLHAQSTGSTTGSITIRIDDLKNDEGMVRAELTTAQNYDNDGNVRAAELAIQDTKARWIIEDVPAGTYAVRLYHDEDNDDALDTNLVGIPQEAFGFSNNVRGTMGPPDFEEAAFTIKDGSRSMTITVE